MRKLKLGEMKLCTLSQTTDILSDRTPSLSHSCSDDSNILTSRMCLIVSHTDYSSYPFEMMNLCICSFSWFIPQIHSRSPSSMPPPPWGPPQSSQAGLVTLSSLFLLCLIWTSFIALFTLSQKYAPCLPLELSFLAFLTHACVSSAWWSAQFRIGAIRRIVL